MVFSEHTGLTNLYSILRYCLNKTKCRRALIARHFGETWKDSDCQGLCDVCQIIKGAPGSIAHFTNRSSSDVTQEDVTLIAQGFLEAIDKNRSAEKKLTAIKLVDAWKTTDCAKLPSFSKNKPDSEKLERALMHCLLENVLKEDFHFTAYTTICYITTGRRAGLVRANKVKIVVEMMKKKAKPTYPNMSVPPAVSSDDTVTGTAQMTPLIPSPAPEIVDNNRSHVDSFTADSADDGVSDEPRPLPSPSVPLPSTSREATGTSSTFSYPLTDSKEDDQSDFVPVVKKRRLPPPIIDDDDDDDFVTMKKSKPSKSKGKLSLSSRRRKPKGSDKPCLQIVQQPTPIHSDYDITNCVIEIDSD